MKTYKNLYRKICSLKNLFLAYKKARKGKTNKNYVKEFEKNLDKNLLELHKELVNKSYKPRPLKVFIVRDPKTRKICKSNFRDRVIHHALVNVLGPIYERIFIYDNYASRKNKGPHKALKRFDCFKRKVSKNGKLLKGIKDNNYVCGYCLKADISKYFASVDHSLLINIIKRKIKDENVIWLIRQILRNHLGNIRNKGMPFGNYTSQFFANVYLNELDYFVKHELKIKYYIRYVDDFVVLDNSKEQLEIWKCEINRFLKERLKLCLHPDKSKVVSLYKGVCFLGFRNFYYYRLLRKSNIGQMFIRLNEWKELYNEELVGYTTLTSKLAGWLVHAKHGDTYKLRKRIVRKFNRDFRR